MEAGVVDHHQRVEALAAEALVRLFEQAHVVRHAPEDAEEADVVFDELMGNEVEGRRKWIMANADKAELDI